jgi:diguanylate cyclase (GGDEF)-like protein
VVLIDLDDFKAVNDEWGHATGDEVLIAFARALRDRSRAGDHFARVGGDELMAVVADATEDALAAFLGRLRSSWTTSRPHDVTYSAGVAWRGARTVAQTIAAAEEALYSAKRQGRDRVVIAP